MFSVSKSEWALLTSTLTQFVLVTEASNAQTEWQRQETDHKNKINKYKNTQYVK